MYGKTTNEAQTERLILNWNICMNKLPTVKKGQGEKESVLRDLKTE